CGAQDRKYHVMAERPRCHQRERESGQTEYGAKNVVEQDRGHSQPVIEDLACQPAYRVFEARVADLRPARSSRLNQVPVVAREQATLREPLTRGVEGMRRCAAWR